MTNIIKSKYKASRRAGQSIWGTNKDPIHTKNYRPGQHGQNNTRKTSDYGVHLKAKQKLKSHYGRINEKQFKNTFALAHKMKGNTGENFIALLESRLDMVVYRLNIASTIFTARQLVSHKHIKVNGRRINIPSFKVKEGDVIELHENSRSMAIILESISKLERSIPEYLSLDAKAVSGKFVRTPTIADIPYPFDPEVHLVIEMYSH